VTTHSAFLVVLLGIDGAGKSTVAERTADRLRKDGSKRVVVYWARWQPRLIRWLRGAASSLLVRGPAYVGGNDEPAQVSRLKARVFSRWRFIGSAYLSLALADYWLQHARRLRRLAREADVVLLDRYWYDLIVDAVGNDPDARERLGDLLARSWQRWFPRPDLIILLDVDPGVASARKKGENTAAFLAARRKLYHKVGTLLGARVFDANQSVDTITLEITAHVTAMDR
jgi:thymidylate kinase